MSLDWKHDKWKNHEAQSSTNPLKDGTREKIYNTKNRNQKNKDRIRKNNI
jgi:hypothetical protein